MPRGENPIWVFVYGTLLPGEINHGVLSPHALEWWPGAVRGHLVDVGPYPALVPGTDGRVTGQWVRIAPEGLRPLDELELFRGIEEPNEYERVWIKDLETGRAGWTYVWPDDRGFAVIPGGDWPSYRTARGEAKQVFRPGYLQF
ncbi:gamma-glutamylcyclotransferase [Paenibacillus thermoaerophilus]|uniref:Gamma-glutamylcyclotransferase n=1 Tax=Paenibacillus thermoaerophilus TaxID=1215385 RepID=A0ABW2V0L9_9BACL|nr:gamma-glutamylcyclotransferase family protein [Paenibacillus thermoaerophilus]TMV15917.1 gamma-glutamylcyclotransferase [Paenibacillus thermoaerophilus]